MQDGDDVAIRELRMDGIKAGRFLPLADRPDEIAASPIVTDVREIGPATLFCGDCRAISVLLRDRAHACVTDPPYELGFMGKSWDSSGVAAAWETWGAIRIALRPGAHLVAFAGSRTYHRIAAAIDDAGFEVRDQILWIYGSGFPKSMDVAKAIDKLGGGYGGVGPESRSTRTRSGPWARTTGGPQKGRPSSMMPSAGKAGERR